MKFLAAHLELAALCRAFLLTADEPTLVELLQGWANELEEKAREREAAVILRRMGSAPIG